MVQNSLHVESFTPSENGADGTRVARWCVYFQTQNPELGKFWPFRPHFIRPFVVCVAMVLRRFIEQRYIKRTFIERRYIKNRYIKRTFIEQRYIEKTLT
jgi:hypothetical protein